MQSSTVNLSNNVRASIFAADGTDFDPETLAMLQAFYSRSDKSIADRVQGLNAEQVKNSLRKFYVNYGHRSIGQCANFTVFLEDVSIIAAKFIQHSPLYNGQETSTRYYNFGERPMVLPQPDQYFEDSMRGIYVALLSAARASYLDAAAAVGPVDATMERTCEAKAFDLARSVLCGGYTTKLSWTTNFDQSNQHLRYLVNSPVRELNHIGLSVGELLHGIYPSAVPEVETLHDANLSDILTNEFFDNTMLLQGSRGLCETAASGLHFTYGTRSEVQLSDYARSVLASRARGAELPPSFAKYGTYSFNFDIDFGSWRDLHRHRNGLVTFPSFDEMPVMHPWYLNEISSLGIAGAPGINGMTIIESIRWIYSHLLHHVRTNVLCHGGARSEFERAEMMYYVPMGSLVRAHMRYDLQQAIYVAELRSARTVHATARISAHMMAEALRATLPLGSKVHTDSFDEMFSRKRGEQTILERN